MGKDGKGWHHLPDHRKEAKVGSGTMRSARRGCCFLPPPEAWRRPKTQQNGCSLVAKRKPYGRAQGPLSVHSPPCYSLPGSAPRTRPATFSSSPSPGLQGSPLLCHLLWRGARGWGAVGAQHPVRERRKPCCCFCKEGSVPASHVCLSPPVTSSARAPPPLPLVPQASFPAVKFPGRPQGQQPSPNLPRHPGFSSPTAAPPALAGWPQFNTFSEKCPSFPSSCTGRKACPRQDGLCSWHRGPAGHRGPPLPAAGQEPCCSSAHFSL